MSSVAGILRVREFATISLILAFVTLLFLPGTTTLAADADDLAKEANTELRAAQRSMFSGKYDEASAKLLQVAALLERIKAANASHRSLRTLQQRFDSLKRDVERRSKKKIETETPKKSAKKKPDKPVGKSPPSAKLPGGVTFRLKKIKEILDEGKAGNPFTIMEEIEKRYGDQIPSGHPEVEAVKKRLARLKSDQDAKAQADAEAAARMEVARQHREAQSQKWIAKLGVYINFRSDKYLISSIENNRATPEEKTQRAEIYKEAVAAFSEYEATEFPHGRTDALAALTGRLAERLEEFRQDVHKVAIEKASEPWLEKLDRYVSSYDVVNSRVNPNRLLVETTQDVKELTRIKAVYEEARKVFADYQKADFPLGRSYKLEMVAQEFQRLLEEFPKAYEENAVRVLASPEKALTDSSAILAKDTKWLDDPKAKPRVLGEDRMKALKKLVAKASSLGGSDSAQVAALENKLTLLVKENEKRRQICTERTFVIPDRYVGTVSAEIKKKSDEIVAKAVSGATILRTTIVSKDWKEQRVWEWTDTSRSAVRFRVTRSVSAQVAAKKGDDVYLYTVHVARDRNQDGSWTDLYGHIMFTDRMLEKNVLVGK